MKNITVKAESKLQKGCVVFVENGVAKLVKPENKPLDIIVGMAKRDIEKGETIKYNSTQNTEDIMIRGSYSDIQSKPYQNCVSREIYLDNTTKQHSKH